MCRPNECEQGELVFHNTIPLSGEELEGARGNAVKQKEIILNFFRHHPDRNFTPTEVFEQCNEAMMLLTSVRRSITDLTKEGRLIKCDISDSRKGAYGTLNRTWRYNSEYVKPINLPDDYVDVKTVKVMGEDFTVKKLKSF